MKSIKTKFKGLLLLFLLPLSCLGQANPFGKLVYDKAMAYEYQGEGGLLIENCLQDAKEKIDKQMQLTPEQIKTFESVVCAEDSYGSTTASCFDPHFAVVYYRAEQIVGSVSICMECNYLESSVKIPATELTMIQVSDDYAYAANGFSKSARQEIHNFMIALGFTEYLKPLTSIFDE